MIRIGGTTLLDLVAKEVEGDDEFENQGWKGTQVH
jgi:hypothetical protein